MGDPAYASDERGELAALRERAYGPASDIVRDPQALARLDELEDRARLAREQAITGASAAAAVRGTGVGAESSIGGLRRWHTASVALTAGAALVLGFAAFERGAASSDIPVVEDQDWAMAVPMSPSAGYAEYLDHLRGELLAEPGMSAIAVRLIRDELRPYGSLYGRSVWRGSTTDRQYCMIIDDTPRPAIGCIWSNPARTESVSITLPAGFTTSAFDVAAVPGTPIVYTLMPGGHVTVAPVTDASAP
ncbi:hypothetical protein [Microbacterium sp. P03]|uniref:hypothetical protein n=1 Tax=Microbacterium sp. P03 TaxID=3366946 RepID=UPI003747743F